MKNKNTHLIFGYHSLSEAINAGKEVNKVFLRRGIKSEQFAGLFQKIRESGIPYQYVPIEKLNSLVKGNHQGVVASLSLIEYKNLEEIIQRTFESGRDPFIVILDGVTDIRNFGAIARTAVCAGVDAIVIPEKGSVAITADAIKTSAGALNRVAVSRSKNQESTIQYIKESGIKVVAASEKSTENYFNADLTGPVAVLMGAEGSGIKASLLRMADCELRIPSQDSIDSLNVSVAFGIIAFEVVRQRYMMK